MLLRITCALCLLAVAVARFEDVAQYTVFDATSAVTSASILAKGETYGRHLVLQVPFNGEPIDIELFQNRELFHPEWSLITYDAEGEVISKETDSTKYACHYTGKVIGDEDSYVAMSVCNGQGINGQIHTKAFTAEIQPMDETSKRTVGALGQHIIYDMAYLVLPDELVMDHVDVETSTDVINATTGTRMRATYTNNVVIASDNYRMNAYSSSSSEASNTQSVINSANTPYSNTNWGSSNTIRFRIHTQHQGSAWSHSSNMNTALSNLASFKNSRYSSRDNVQAFTHFSYGDTIGLAYINTMCSGRNSCGLNNVGFSSSTGLRGVLVAHETGHNYSFGHDGSTRGYVMSCSINGAANSFSSKSVSSWNSNRNRFSCM